MFLDFKNWVKSIQTADYNGAGAIVKNWGAVRKCVWNNYRSVRAVHSKISSNPTSESNLYLSNFFNLMNTYFFK